MLVASLASQKVSLVKVAGAGMKLTVSYDCGILGLTGGKLIIVAGTRMKLTVLILYLWYPWLDRK
jgi:hypothetical protein